MAELINREKVVAELYKLSDDLIKAGRHQMALGVNDSIMLVGELMPTEAERKYGYWKHTFGGYVNCSECGSPPLFDNTGEEIETEYCPSCGADMRG